MMRSSLIRFVAAQSRTTPKFTRTFATAQGTGKASQTQKSAATGQGKGTNNENAGVGTGINAPKAGYQASEAKSSPANTHDSRSQHPGVQGTASGHKPAANTASPDRVDATAGGSTASVAADNLETKHHSHGTAKPEDVKRGVGQNAGQHAPTAGQAVGRTDKGAGQTHASGHQTHHASTQSHQGADTHHDNDAASKLSDAASTVREKAQHAKEKVSNLVSDVTGDAPTNPGYVIAGCIALAYIIMMLDPDRRWLRRDYLEHEVPRIHRLQHPSLDDNKASLEKHH